MTIQITFTGETAREALEQLREFTAGLAPAASADPDPAFVAKAVHDAVANAADDAARAEMQVKRTRTVKPKAETPKTDSEPESSAPKTEEAKPVDEKALRDKIIQIFTPLMADSTTAAKVTELLADFGRVSKIPADQLEAFVTKAEELAKGA